ncbi:MAG: TonB-dependent receptor plug domain-containing protein [Sporocytophaga sp.]|uniref:TonB-dependent receptor n=1 Tax=Sporocytophaga sp. TaxID=2231183 RepID=UPI001B242EBA|nr:TonB-dependent receptor [Sporocytophaga sp.]MBO9702826.1 TonB-dependent receptor plug domain-containing protein [Sporocytophaga sp.]
MSEWVRFDKILCNTVVYVLVFFSFFSAQAQNDEMGTVKGRIQLEDGEPAIFASIGVKGESKGELTDEEGRFELQLKPGKYTIIIQLVGYENIEKVIDVKAAESVELASVVLKAPDNHLEEVKVFGKSEIQEVQQQSYNVATIDAKKLHNSTLDLSSALDKVSGVRVRESGGVGSNFNFSLNGFTGRQVKFFMDGIPMDNFGSSFQINNIPINLAERIEVYKGVVPVWLGADALGGAVNIVTNANRRNYLDASYSYGSFNTHRTSINAGYTSKSGLTAQLNLFQNYSDNNYWVYADVAQIPSGLYLKDQRVRRFHDTYRNETLIANVGVRRKKFADLLLLGVTLGQNRADIQTGARMVSVFGDFYRKGNTIMPSFRYSKSDLLIKGLTLNVTGNYNLGQEQNVDTVARRYNWFQQYTNTTSPGSERERSLYKFRNNNAIATANISYKFNNKHSIALNNVITSFNRKGEDELRPDAEALKQPKITLKNIIGLGYKYDFNARWSTSVFVKQFIQKNTSSLSAEGPGGWGNTIYIKQHSLFNKTGFGLATSYFLSSIIQVKASYEKSYRLPENEELFGDMINLSGNNSLKPESSHNLNLGATLNKTFASNHVLVLEGNIMYREAYDFIRPALVTNGTHQIMTNQRDVNNIGFNGDVRYSFKRLFHAGANLTYQNLRNNTKYEEGSSKPSTVYRDRVPNIPYLFGHIDLGFTFNNVGAKGNRLNIGYNLLYVYEYYLRWPSQGTATEKYTIPAQISHDVSMVYSMANGKYNIGLECTNLTDSRLYDNFSLQKPSRGFYIKLRYFLTEK